MPQDTDLAKALYELDKRQAVFQAHAVQRWTSDEQFQFNTSQDLKELKTLVTNLRIKRAADQAIVSMIVTGAGLFVVKLLEKLVG